MRVADILRFFGIRGNEPEQSIERLAAADAEQLQNRIAVVNEILARYYPDVSLNSTVTDLSLLQRILSDDRFQPDQTYELQCLGAALGNILAREISLHWVIVEDQYGRDLALQYADSSLIVHPLTMISKRVERGESVDVTWLFETTREHIKNLAKEADRAR